MGLLDFQAGGPRDDGGEIDLSGEAVDRVANGRVPPATVELPVSGDDLLGLLCHGGDQVGRERLVARGERVRTGARAVVRDWSQKAHCSTGSGRRTLGVIETEHFSPG
ncbi:hypothetical protein ACGF13_20710 [Kitasatospora sp. NPDC048286]|uniref:hypothetical protein n=1 Tax=Kitasatospora sp. NPDC048286 TaxID=3364047 RepID=UPI00371662A5